MTLSTKRLRRTVSFFAVLLALLFAAPVAASEPTSVRVDRNDRAPASVIDGAEWTVLPSPDSVEWTDVPDISPNGVEWT